MKKNANKEIEVSLSDYIEGLTMSIMPSRNRVKQAFKNLENNSATDEDMFTLEYIASIYRLSERSRRKK